MILFLNVQVAACASISSSSPGLDGAGLVPSLLWSHLLHSLLPSILEFRRGEGDLLVLNVKHSVIRKVVQKRYIESEKKRLQLLAQLSGYFSGKLQGCSHIQKQGEGQEEGHQEVELVDPSGAF